MRCKLAIALAVILVVVGIIWSPFVMTGLSLGVAILTGCCFGGGFLILMGVVAKHIT